MDRTLPAEGPVGAAKRQFRPSLFRGALGVAAASFAVLGAEPENGLPPPAGGRLVLARAGAAACPVLVEAGAPEPERHAARELARFLGEIAGRPFQLLESGASPALDRPAVLVGPGAAAGIVTPEEVQRLGEEGYVLRTRGPVLAIAGGRPRGTLYGIYSFLEDELGCRWFTPDVSRIPRKQSVEVGPLDRTFVPALELRATDSPSSRDPDWAVRNKLNGPQTGLEASRGGKISYGPFVHTFNSILDPAVHFDRHPEWFSEVKGQRLRDHTQLCVTNPVVQRMAAETVRRWMRESPQARIFSVSQNDWQNWCTCKECSRVIEEEGSPAGAYLRFVNAIAAEVREEFPGRAVDTLAYQFTRRPPRSTVPLPEVIVRLCSIECCFSHPLSSPAEIDPENAAFASDLARWARLSRRLYVWDYVVDFAHSFLPFPNLDSLGPNIRFFVENGVKGVYEESCYFTRGGELSELRSWILAKTLWDPSYDTGRAKREFLEGYYEEAGRPLGRYIDLLEEKVRRDDIHFHIFDEPGNRLFSPDLLERAEEVLAEARKQVAAKPEVLRRVEVASLPLAYLRISSLLEKLQSSSGARDAERRALVQLFEGFDAVCRREGVSRVSEGRSYEDWARVLKEALASGGGSR